MITEHFKSIATLIAVEAKARFIGRLWLCDVREEIVHCDVTPPQMCSPPSHSMDPASSP